MILFRGLNCPSSISFVEVSERGIVKVSAVLAIHMWHSVKTYGKHLKNNLSPRVGCLTATLDVKAAYSDADFVVIAAPTNVYSTKSVEV